MKDFVFIMIIVGFISSMWFGIGYGSGFHSAISESDKVKYMYETNKKECYIEINGIKYKTDCNDEYPYDKAIVFVSQ